MSNRLQELKELSYRLKILKKLKWSFIHQWPSDYEAAKYYKEKVNEVATKIMDIVYNNENKCQ